MYAASRHDVSDVWVAGQRRVRAGQLLGVDREALMATAARWALQAQAAVRAGQAKSA